MKLLPYQQHGMGWLASSPANSCRLLADDPGLGKTAQAITAACAIPRMPLQNSVLIICPASLRVNWAREWAMWGDTRIEPTIVSYDAVRKAGVRKGGPFYGQWPVVILDEAHSLRNKSAKRTEIILGHKGVDYLTGECKHYHGLRADRMWFLTGTPISRCPADFFTLLHHCDPWTFNDEHYYQERYCGGYYGEFGWTAEGATNLGELRKKIEDSGIMLRRLKADVLTQLPPKRRQVFEVPWDGGKTKQKKLNGLLYQASGGLLTPETLPLLETDSAFFDRVMSEMTRPRTASSYSAQGAQGAQGETGYAPGTHEVREYMFDAKLPAFKAWLDQQIEERGPGGIEKTVVWACYHRSIDVISGLLVDAGVDHVVYDGRTPMAKRDQLVRNFQVPDAGGPRIFVGSSAAYTGITLTAASRAVFLEWSFLPMDNVQAEDRIHRIGSTGPVLIQYLAVEGSYDTHVLRAMVRRMDAFKTLLG